MKIGSVVRLKSGGPYMTVTRVGHPGSYVAENHVKCDWFVKGEHKDSTFPVASLNERSKER